jgi:hypothetical protein
MFIKISWNRNSKLLPGANLTTSEFTTTSRLEHFFNEEEKKCFQNALGYLWRCKICTALAL